MSLPTLTTPLTSTPLAFSVEGGGGGGGGAGGGGGGLGSCQEGGDVNPGSLGRPGSSLVAMLGIVGGVGGRTTTIAGERPGAPGAPGDPGRPGVPGRPGAVWGPAVVPLGNAGIDGTPGIDDAGAAAISGEPAGLAPGRPGPAGCRPVVPLGKPGREGSPGIDAGDPAMSGEPAGAVCGRPGAVCGRPGAVWGRVAIGDLHWGMEVNGRLGRLDTPTGLWVSGSSAIPPPPGALWRCPGLH